MKSEFGFMKAETCRCYVLLINYTLRNKVVLNNKITYFYVSKSISKLRVQIQVATYVFELSAGNCHR